MLTGLTCSLAATVSSARAAPTRVASNLQLSILSPEQTVNGDKLSLDVSFRGSAVETVELYLDKALVAKRQLGTAQTRGVLSFGLETALLTEGEHSLMVKAYTNDGQAFTTLAKVRIPAADLSAPVRIAYPQNGIQVSGVVPVRVAIDPSIQKLKPYVTFFVDKELKVLRNYPPYEYVWDTSKVANGWHLLEAWTTTDDSVTKARIIHVNVNNGGGETKVQDSIPDLSAENTAPTAAKAQPKDVVNTMPVKPISVDPSTARSGSDSVQPKVTVDTTTGVQASNVHPVIGQNNATPVKPSGNGMAAVSAPAVQSPAIEANSVGVQSTASHPAAENVGARPVEPSAQTLPKRVMVAGVQNLKTTAVVPMRTMPAVKPVQPVVTDKAMTSVPVIKPTGTDAIVMTVQPVSPRSMGQAVSRPAARMQVASVPRNMLPAMASVPVVVKIHPAVHPKSWQSLLSSHSGLFDVAFDDERIAFDVSPRMEQGMALAPFRQIFEHTGGQLYWFGGNAQTVRAVNATREIELKIGDRHALVNNQSVLMDKAPYLISGRTIVPLTFIRDAMDVSISYDSATGRLLIQSKQ